MVAKTNSKAKPQAKPATQVKAKSAEKSAEVRKPKSIVLGRAKPSTPVNNKTISKPKSASSGKVKVVRKVVSSNSAPIERRHSKGLRIPQYNFMKAPGITHDFQVGDTVDVFCDHEKNKERIRGWVNGVVVQVDNKMVAVQFRSNVYLTDGWMVPDRILWSPLSSEHIRAFGVKKPVKEMVIPDY